MPIHPSSSIQQAREVLAARLREVRLDSGLSAREVAAASGWHESKCSRMQSGKQAVADSDIKAWCAACGADEHVTAELVSMNRQLDSAYVEWRRMQGGGLKRLQDAVMPLWEKTRNFRIYEPGVVPGFLQTHGYASALLARIGDFFSLPHDGDEAAGARVERQRLLYEGGHRFAVLIEESVLRTNIGDVDVMAGQLGHLLDIMTLPSVSLGVIPFSVLRTMWPVEGFWILDDEQVVIETVSAKITVRQAGELDLYRRTFSELSSMAVNGRTARALISAAIAAL
ncbi:helix-turn-helix domain-containing protein [Actinomadura madurae]|uniref:helix-turn-helix domain-containing protein n=2 Tax=Actinomadura madurae TaxID=1993 RepID=UPI0020D25705|nr:helix-turn-helix transcriptional regulator [Actinomadura madurae]MCP9953842.1 helix-turn-helix domain-containing protein [Actinomadura madurae]MCP9970592.1 helix-turn-helix domain-containing protein [Actinomadura madurae]MCP9983064.1 helix-turn-helix domain-containing protein [Actinomadura madurae]MCQ0005377.1 helix-turn-helix domain-containing protein [Actinomadura madurae]MCQ0019309.1 helix-turn-helix domain-containing protein [Actinomadura madurae]